MRTRRSSMVVGLALSGLVLAGCSSWGGSTPDLTGTWTGTGTYPDVDGTVKSSTERFVVTKQDGPLVWGTVDYANPDGSKVTEKVTGTLLADGTHFVFTERASLWQGQVTGGTLNVVVSWTGDPSHGAFQMTLTRE